MMMASRKSWNVKFLHGNEFTADCKYGLIILNQPFSLSLLNRLWVSTQWHCCADGGANRLYDSFHDDRDRVKHLPDLIKGDLDSIRSDVRRYYDTLVRRQKNVIVNLPSHPCNQGVPIVQDHDQDSTDLTKCVFSLSEKEKAEKVEYNIILLGGLSGRLDQTIHTLSYLHKLRKERKEVFAVTDDNIGWVLDEGEHEIEIEHDIMGQTCGILPVGIESTILSTSGLRWNLENQLSSFDGLVSTSNHLVPEETFVWIKTSKPIWWTAELKNISGESKQ